MANPLLTFLCPRCGRRMGIGPELAGRQVRCPLCREVVTAPASAVDAEPGVRTQPSRGPEGVESIFADPEESEDSVIGGVQPRKKPVMPSDPGLPPVSTPRPPRRTAVPFVVKPPSSQSNPTVPPSEGSPPQPVDPGNPFANLGAEPPKPRSGPVKDKTVRTPPSLVEASEPIDAQNPFAGLSSEPPLTESRAGKSKRVSRRDTETPSPHPEERVTSSGSASKLRSPRVTQTAIPLWVWLVFLVMAGYGFLMTVIAAWGWLR
jgi:hypothetical protein